MVKRKLNQLKNTYIDTQLHMNLEGFGLITSLWLSKKVEFLIFVKITSRFRILIS